MAASGIIGSMDNEEIETMGPRHPRVEAMLSKLTLRERQVARLALTGLPYQNISETLEMAIKTVKHHMNNIFKVLKVDSRAELAAKVFDYTLTDAMLLNASQPSAHAEDRAFMRKERSVA